MTPPPSSATARATAADPTVSSLERPTPAGANAPGFGSDVVADTLRALDIPYIALNPGASYRGLHDSLVNYLGNERRRCCSACTRKPRSRSRTAMPRSPARRWPRRCIPTSA